MTPEAVPDLRHRIRPGTLALVAFPQGLDVPACRVDNFVGGEPVAATTHSDSVAEAAVTYTDLGWPVFLLSPSSKIPFQGTRGVHDATTDIEAIGDLLAKTPDANIAIAMGEVLVVLDVDPRNGGVESFSRLILGHDDFPETCCAITGGGGTHYFFRHPGGLLNKDLGEAFPGLDLQGTGRYVVAPPSIHPNGTLYSWSLRPDECEPAPMPRWLLELARQKPKSTERLPEIIAQGKRHRSMVSLAGRLVNAGLCDEELAAALHKVNSERCDPPLPDSDIDKLVVSTRKWEARRRQREEAEQSGIEWGGEDEDAAPPPRGEDRLTIDDLAIPETLPDIPPELQSFPRTDIGNAERLVALNGADIRHCELWRSWMVWDGRRWLRDQDGEIMRRAKHTVRRIMLEGANEPVDKLRAAIGKWAVSSESQARQNAMVALAKSQVPVTPDDFDTDPMALNVQNGTVDLRDGSLRRHERSRMLTKLAPVEYHPDAEAPIWQAFLSRVLGGDDELIDFLQRAVGYSLTGDTGEQCFFLLHGTGANGKSVFLRTIGKLLGDYANQADFESFLARRGEGPRNDIADLKGARFVAAIEAEEGKRLAESMIKSLTGGDKIKARFLYSEHFTFEPQFKIWLGANHKPVVRGTDEAIWRRIRLVPFEVTIPETERDPTLPQKLETELPGILRWALVGCERWQAGGLTFPHKVRLATNQYREASDLIGEFIDEVCCVGPEEAVAVAELYKEYQDWCEKAGERALTKHDFGVRLDERGFRGEKSGGSRIRRGLDVARGKLPM